MFEEVLVHLGAGALLVLCAIAATVVVFLGGRLVLRALEKIR